MNKKVITVDVTKVGEGHMETMVSIDGSPRDVSIALAEILIEVNDCTNGSGMMKVQNGFWLLIQDMVNHELAKRAIK